MIVAAENRCQARDLAILHADDALGDSDVSVGYSRDIVDRAALRYTGWDEHAVAYGVDETIGEFLDACEEDRRVAELAARQLKLPMGDEK